MAGSRDEPPTSWWAYQFSRLRRSLRGAGSVASSISEYVGAGIVALLGVWKLQLAIALTGDERIDGVGTALALTWVLTVLWRFVLSAPYELHREEKAEYADLAAKVVWLEQKMSPEIVERSPRYLMLRHDLDPDKGVLSPVNRMTDAKKHLEELAKEVHEGNPEAYYIAVAVADWLLGNARKYYASTAAYFDIANAVKKTMDSIHTAFERHLK